MKAVFGILSLVVALTTVALVAKLQLQPVAGGGIVGRDQGAERRAPTLAADPASLPARAPDASVPQQVRSIQERARDDIVQALEALEQGADRKRRADEP